MSTIVVGSLKEQTKIGDIDEADIVLALRESFNKDQLNFDKKEQRIMVRKYFYDKVGNNAKKIELQLPEELKPFVSSIDPAKKYQSDDDSDSPDGDSEYSDSSSPSDSDSWLSDSDSSDDCDDEEYYGYI